MFYLESRSLEPQQTRAATSTATKNCPWGMSGLTSWEARRVREGNVLALNFIAMCEGASLRGGGHLAEHPEDPGEEPFPSLWDMAEMQDMERRTGHNER